MTDFNIELKIFQKKVNEQIRKVFLYFPESFTNLNESRFEFSLNDARNSDFLSVLLEDELQITSSQKDNVFFIDDQKHIHIVIPQSLYHGISGSAVQEVCNLWRNQIRFTQNACYYLTTESQNSLPQMAKLVQALTLSDSMDFVKVLNERYHPCKV
jgi:hypothetical protein